MVSTDNTPTATLCDHLLPSMLVAQHCAASVDRHQPVEALNGNFVTSSQWATGGQVFLNLTIQKRLEDDYSSIRHHLPEVARVGHLQVNAR